MSKKQKFSDQEINDFLSGVDVPLGKHKDALWSEKFQPLVTEQGKQEPHVVPLFRLNWMYGIAASIAILIAVTIYLDPLKTNQNEVVSNELIESDEELLADETMIESLFVEDSEFDDWFEERYVLNALN